MENRNILVTGGAGYIGSHTCVALIEAGFTPVIVDNLGNSRPAVLQRLGQLCGITPVLHRIDIRDKAALARVVEQARPTAVIHFAGLKSVAESVADPLAYYDNNVSGTITLLRVLAEQQINTLIFSSSATVYGAPDVSPIRESAPLRPESPYGRSKLMVEYLLRDFAAAHDDSRIGILRYFNPVGAHPSGLIGEDPRGIPNNLMPFIAQVAVGIRPALRVFGNDYPTRDGTGVRDYIHVVDLALGHVAALRRALARPGLFTVNLGTGCGHSVLEVVAAFRAASGVEVPLVMAARRAGDVAEYYADTELAARELGWRAQRTLAMMCADEWNWRRKNPQGYDTSGE